MARITLLMLVCVIPPLILGLEFPTSSIHATLPGVEAYGPIALYVVLLQIAIRLTKADRLDIYSHVREELSGDWKILIQDKNVGICSIFVNENTQKLGVNGFSQIGDTRYNWAVEHNMLNFDYLIMMIFVTSPVEGRVIARFDLVPGMRKRGLRGELRQIGGTLVESVFIKYEKKARFRYRTFAIVFAAISMVSISLYYYLNR